MRNARPLVQLIRIAALSGICILGCRSLDATRLETTMVWSVARQWSEVALEAIRNDFAKPTSHARNLYHLSVAMWDAWAAYDKVAIPVLADERHAVKALKNGASREAARNESISFAAYRVLRSRYRNSPGAIDTIPRFDALLKKFGYDRRNTGTDGNSPAAIGNRIGLSVLAFGSKDGSHEEASDINTDLGYAPVNPPLVVAEPGTGPLKDANRWQPLQLEISIDQAGRELPSGVQLYLGPHWGGVTPFALEKPYYDPGPPPHLGGTTAAKYQDIFLEVVRFGTLHSPDDGVLIDISPGSRGANALGTNNGKGREINPHSGRPYDKNVAKRGDWSRVIAEFWADGPDSETPPGHWNVLANYVTDHPDTVRRFEGKGPMLDPLEWDVKLYLALNGALHDAAISAWGLKARYDYVRPITAIRHMAALGQSTDREHPTYHAMGLPLEEGVVEIITETSTAPGGKHEHLSGHIGEIAIFAWLGEPEEPETQYSGVEWIRGLEWIPYQRSTFVTPPFAGYVSGHSTFSRARAEIMTRFTGSEFFPGGIGEFIATKNEYLVFEEGPSETVVLQWATYYDAADEAGLSRLYGGIHPRVDDLPGRTIGAEVGTNAYFKARHHYGPE